MGEYTALYRAFRPRRFGEVVGQEHVTRTLCNAVAAGRVAHAYLFSGPRGTGKTSVARILARAVNCREPAGGEPCNECPPCREVLEGRSVDVVEVDAASHRGIDEVRSLRDQVRYAPLRCSRKVYIIDEVHMLTAEAFNALLKTLEEPPPAVIFVLATTDLHKVPATVASRCQRFDFFRLGEKEIVGHLRSILTAVGGQAEEEALVHLARAADGAMRDALTLLDQALAGAPGQGGLTVAHVADLLGTAPEEELLPVLRSLFAGDAAALLEAVQEAYRRGRDLRQLVLGLMRLVREGLAARAARSGAAAPRDGSDRGTAWEGVYWDRLVATFEGLGRLEQELRRAGPVLLLLEVGLLQLARSAASVEVAGPTGGREEAESKPGRERGSAATFVYHPGAASPVRASPEQALPPRAAPPSGSGSDRDAGQLWRRSLERVRRERPLLHGVLTAARPTGWRDGTLVLSFRAGCNFHRDRVADPRNKTYLEQVLTSFAGRPVELRCLLEGEERDEGEATGVELTETASAEGGAGAEAEEAVATQAGACAAAEPSAVPAASLTGEGDLPALALEILGGEMVDFDAAPLFVGAAVPESEGEAP